MLKHLVFFGLVALFLSVVVESRAQEVGEGEEPQFIFSPILAAEEAAKKEEEEEQQQQEEEAAEMMFNALLEQTNAEFNALFKDFPFDQVIEDSAAPEQPQQEQEYYFVPRTDIYETQMELRFEVEVPAVLEKDITVTVEKNMLTVQGICDPLQLLQQPLQQQQQKQQQQQQQQQQQKKKRNLLPDAMLPSSRPLALPQDVEEVMNQMALQAVLVADNQQEEEEGREEEVADLKYKYDDDQDDDQANDDDDERMQEVMPDSMGNGMECNKEYIRIERPHGRFMRKFMLPTESVGEKVSAKLEKGVLTIVVPKHPSIVQHVPLKDMEKRYA